MPVPSTTRPHILVVEDEKHLGVGIKYNLEAENYRVTLVEDGPTALRMVESSGETIQLIILDLMLPGMSGYTVCESIRDAGLDTPILMLSARTLAEAPPAAILCEDRSAAVQHTLSTAGFQPCAYNPFTRQLSPDSEAGGGNQLWVHNLGWAQERLRTAPAFSLLGERI